MGLRRSSGTSTLLMPLMENISSIRYLGGSGEVCLTMVPMASVTAEGKVTLPTIIPARFALTRCPGSNTGVSTLSGSGSTNRPTWFNLANIRQDLLAANDRIRPAISSRMRRNTALHSSTEPCAAARSSMLQWTRSFLPGNIGQFSFALSQTVMM